MKFWSRTQPPWDHPGCGFLIGLWLIFIFTLWYVGAFG